MAAIAWRADPRWQIAAIGNRDEFHARPTAPLARWDNGVIAGRDVQAGGTWLGVTGTGRFALVTNVRVEGYPRPGMASRGDLVTNWLLARGADSPGAMNPFNLFTADPRGAALATNHPVPRTAALGNGIHGLSNGPLTARWAKTARLELALQDWLARGSDDPEALLHALADRTPCVQPVDARDGPAPALSGVFIADPVYGTRCSSVVLVDRDGTGRIIERSYLPGGGEGSTSAIGFRWPAA